MRPSLCEIAHNGRGYDLDSGGGQFCEVNIVLEETPSVVFPATCDGTGAPR